MTDRNVDQSTNEDLTIPEFVNLPYRRHRARLSAIAMVKAEEERVLTEMIAADTERMRREDWTQRTGRMSSLGPSLVGLVVCTSYAGLAMGLVWLLARLLSQLLT